MKSDNYIDYFTFPNLMGPNSLRLLDELLESYPLSLNSGSAVLDLGCGSGLSSLFLARETGAQITAVDLWINEEDNRRRFERWGVADKVTPVKADAAELPFESETFDAVVSIDSFHYFGDRAGFLDEKILPLVKPGGSVLICVPGVKSQYAAKKDASLYGWLGEETYMFRSTDEWKQLLGAPRNAEQIEVREMFGFYKPWEEWFATQHEYALKDKIFFENTIKPVTCFIGIMAKKK